MLLYGVEDVAKLIQFVEASEAPEARKRVERGKLDALLGLCETAHGSAMISPARVRMAASSSAGRVDQQFAHHGHARVAGKMGFVVQKTPVQAVERAGVSGRCVP